MSEDVGEVVLSKSEHKLYRILCYRYDLDPSQRVSGRLLQVEPIHWAQLTFMCAEVSAHDLSQTVEQMESLTDYQEAEVAAEVDTFMRKVADAMNEAELKERCLAYSTVLDDSSSEYPLGVLPPQIRPVEEDDD